MNDLGERVCHNVGAIAACVPFLLRDELFEIPEYDCLGNQSLEPDLIIGILFLFPVCADQLRQFAEVLLCAEADLVGKATIGILKLREIGLREELGARKLGVKLLPIPNRAPTALIRELPTGALIEPLGFPVTFIP